FVAQAPHVDAPLDGVVRFDLRPVVDKIDVGLGAIPGDAGGVADKRIRVAPHGDGRETARKVVEGRALDTDRVGSIGPGVEVLRFVAVAAQADAGFGDEGRRNRAGVVDGSALGAVDTSCGKALAAAAIDAETAGVGHDRALEAVTRGEAILVAL